MDEGLLGFIGGVTGTLSKEYDRMNEESADIRKEERALERELAAEKRREAAERRMELYRENLRFKMEGRGHRRDLDRVTRGEDIGLVRAEATNKMEGKWWLEGTHSDLAAHTAKTEQELADINAGRDPASARKEYDDLSLAERIRLGLDSETAGIQRDLDMSPQTAEAEAELTRKKEAARLQAEREDEKLREKEGLPPKNSKNINLDFSVSEAKDILDSQLELGLGMSIKDVKTQIADYGSVLKELGTSNSFTDVLTGRDAEAKRQALRNELVVKLYPTVSNHVAKAANAKQITDPVQVEEAAQATLQAADNALVWMEETSKNLAQYRTRAAAGKAPKPPTEVLSALEGSLASALGEDPKKPSPSFKTIWSYYRSNLARELGIVK